MSERKCGGGYGGCVACGAGPHQPCNWDWDNGCRKGENRDNNKALVWLKEEISLPRWAFILCIIVAVIVNILLSG